MRFHHSPAIWRAHPTLVAGVLSVQGITASPDVQDRARPYLDAALRRLGERPASEFPEIQAWRRAFAAMGLKPTQYRCASESLLRRLHADALSLASRIGCQPTQACPPSSAYSGSLVGQPDDKGAEIPRR